MTPQQFLTILTTISIFTILKFFILLALILYFFFALIVVRQVTIMTTTFKTGFAMPLKAVAWAQIGLIIIVFLIVLVFI